ncbi:helix-turn-helix domain-containing protein [Salinicoccus sp. CNSTN-B1]
MTTFKLEQYINFESLEEMNHHVKLHVKNNQLNDTQYKLLTILSQYSVKYLGASYLKLKTLAGLLDVSKRTVQRNLKALVEKGIITKKYQFRSLSGGYGASIYIINHYAETTNVTSDVSSREDSEKSAGKRLLERIEQEETTSSQAKFNNSVVLHSSDKQREYNLSYKEVIPSFIPRKFGEHLIKFFDSATLTRIYRACKKAVEPYEGRVEYDEDRLLDLMLQGSDALISAIKKHRNGIGSPVENKFGYVYHATMNIAISEEFSFM